MVFALWGWPEKIWPFFYFLLEKSTLPPVMLLKGGATAYLLRAKVKFLSNGKTFRGFTLQGPNARGTRGQGYSDFLQEKNQENPSLFADQDTQGNTGKP
jgi:hypothetical protein